MKLTTSTVYYIALVKVIFTTALMMGAASAAGGQGQHCQVFYEWTLTNDTRIQDTQYYAFRLDESTGLGTFTLPIYETLELTGHPVAMLRGNMIAANEATDFTATATLSFFTASAAQKDHLGVLVSYTYNPDEADDLIYGYTIGGTGKFRHYQASVTSVVVATEPKFTVEWTFCNEHRGGWWGMWMPW